jgi:hypothetical protein
MKLPAVNFHVWKYCNYKCKFCFATFKDVRGQMKEAEALEVVEALAPHCEKITFVGGEPTLCPFLGALIDRAHQLGLTTCVVGHQALPRSRRQVRVAQTRARPAPGSLAPPFRVPMMGPRQFRGGPALLRHRSHEEGECNEQSADRLSLVPP